MAVASLAELNDTMLARRAAVLHRIAGRVGYTHERQVAIDAVYMEAARRAGRPQHGCFCRQCCSWGAPKKARRKKGL